MFDVATPSATKQELLGVPTSASSSADTDGKTTKKTVTDKKELKAAVLPPPPVLSVSSLLVRFLISCNSLFSFHQAKSSHRPLHL